VEHEPTIADLYFADTSMLWSNASAETRKRWIRKRGFVCAVARIASLTDRVHQLGRVISAGAEPGDQP